MLHEITSKYPNQTSETFVLNASSVGRLLIVKRALRLRLRVGRTEEYFAASPRHPRSKHVTH